MFRMEEMSRVLYRHEWTRREDWARALHDLAELSDDQIAELEQLPMRDGGPIGRT